MEGGFRTSTGSFMSDSEWVSLRRAADILGVHPATVRNWADKGDLVSRRTPGGHRRFRRADLLRYAETAGELQPLEVQVIIQNALGHTRMQVGGTLNQQSWYEELNESTRSNLRGQGMETLEAIRKYLSSGAPHEGLGMAINSGKHYAALLSDQGMSLPDAVRGFFYFSDFVINSILTWSEITPVRNTAAEWGNLVRQVNTFINTILLSIIEYYEAE
jgi:excisionase family DNA binding protein